MWRNLLVAAATLIALSAGGAKSVSAATITDTFDFTASGFAPAFDINGQLHQPPVDPVIGSFTIIFNPTVPVIIGTTITLNNINITPANLLLFQYQPGSVNFPQVALLNVCSPLCSLPDPTIQNPNSFFLGLAGTVFLSPLSPPSVTIDKFNVFAYAQSSAGGAVFVTSTGSISLVPLPGAFPSMVSVLMGGSLLAWWRKKASESRLKPRLVP
jgi:hypothetical protein